MIYPEIAVPPRGMSRYFSCFRKSTKLQRQPSAVINSPLYSLHAELPTNLETLAMMDHRITEKILLSQNALEKLNKDIEYVRSKNDMHKVIHLLKQRKTLQEQISFLTSKRQQVNQKREDIIIATSPYEPKRFLRT